MSTINLNWLDELHGRAARSKLMPRKPMRSEIAAHARALAAAAAKLTPEDRGAREEQAAVVQFMLDEQAADYERKLMVCYALLAGFGIALVFAGAIIAALAVP